MTMPNGTPTPAQQAASRANGARGGRPKRLSGPAEARRLRLKARAAGQNEAMANLEFWISVRDDPSLSMADRLRASSEIEDRYGTPKQQVAVASPIDMDSPKLVDWGGFAAPPGWNGDEAPVAPATNGAATNGAATNGTAH